MKALTHVKQSAAAFAVAALVLCGTPMAYAADPTTPTTTTEATASSAATPADTATPTKDAAATQPAPTSVAPEPAAVPAPAAPAVQDPAPAAPALAPAVPAPAPAPAQVADPAPAAVPAPAAPAVQDPAPVTADPAPTTNSNLIFPQVSASFQWVDNAAGVGQVTVVNAGTQPVPINAVDTRVDMTWRPCLTADGTVYGITSQYPVGTTVCIVDGLQNGQEVLAAIQGASDFYFRFIVTGVAGQTSTVTVEPAAVTSDGLTYTVPAPTERYVYRSDVSGEIVAPGTYTIPVGGTAPITAVSLSNEVVLTGTTHWDNPYAPKQAGAPLAPSFNDEAKTVTVSGSTHWTVTVNGVTIPVGVGESVTLPIAPYVTTTGHDGLVTVVYQADAGYVDSRQGNASHLEYKHRFTLPGQEPPANPGNGDGNNGTPGGDNGGTPGNGGEDNTKMVMVGICHATGQDDKFVQIKQVSAESIIEERGHAQHQDGRDKIPSFKYTKKGEDKSFDGQNWDQAFFDRGCKAATENPNPGDNPGGDDHGSTPGDDHGNHGGNQPGNSDQPSTPVTTGGNDHQSAPLGDVIESVDTTQQLGQGAVDEEFLGYSTETAARGGQPASAPNVPLLFAAAGSALVGFVLWARRREVTKK